MEEARLERTEYGMTPVTDGWFSVNVRDATWMTNEAFGQAALFEGEERFAQLGCTIHVLAPGQPNGLNHREADQEDFLVLAGECLVLIEGEERRLRAWDFLHCPPQTEHIFVGAGDRPCVIFMVGGRAHPGETVYLRSELALRHGASIEAESDRPYAPYPDWKPGPPDSFDGLPFA